MKRFYRDVGISEADGMFGITLDGKPLPSPAHAAFWLPTEPLARAIALEWDAQDGLIQPASMPLMKLASTAIDRVAAARDAVIAEVARYAETDLLCYRAGDPADLVARQAATWQPLLDWAADALGAPLRVSTGVIPILQPPASLGRFARALHELDDFALTAVADLAAACGSLTLALAVLKGRIDAEAAYNAALLDDIFQIERWGEDAEAAHRLRNLRADIAAAGRFLGLLEVR